MYNKEELIKRLRPYWHKRKLVHAEFMQKEYGIELEMSNDLGDDLIFVYNNGCIGIGINNITNNKSKVNKKIHVDDYLLVI